MRTVAFLRDPRMGADSWAGARWITPGPARTIQLQQTPEEMLPEQVTRQTQLGTDFTPEHYVGIPPYPVEHSRMASYFLSDPSVFQSYFRVHWETMFGASANLAQGTRRLSPLPNPSARGKAEGQAITPYNPWPSGSLLAPEYPGSELKAV